MQNIAKNNGTVITIFTNIVEGISVHTANIDLKVNRIYFNRGTEDYLHLMELRREFLEVDEKKYKGKFDTILEFSGNELTTILKLVMEEV